MADRTCKKCLTVFKFPSVLNKHLKETIHCKDQIVELNKSRRYECVNCNHKFTRQKPLDHFIVDFYCASLGLVIEIDGEIHNFQKARDKERDNILKQKFGLRIIRYKNEDVLKNTGKITEDLIERIRNTTPP